MSLPAAAAAPTATPRAAPATAGSGGLPAAPDASAPPAVAAGASAAAAPAHSAADDVPGRSVCIDAALTAGLDALAEVNVHFGMQPQLAALARALDPGRDVFAGACRGALRPRGRRAEALPGSGARM